jgi:hypothetical protein
MSSESDTSDGSSMSLFSETASSADTHEELQMILQTQFPRCPFHIDCVRDISELDTVFCTDKVILIYDDRLNQKYHNFHDMTISEKNKLRHYTVVKSMGNKPITLRQVLNTMIKDRHYNSRIIEKHFKHYFLEKFIRHMNNMYETCWGN